MSHFFIFKFDFLYALPNSLFLLILYNIKKEKYYKQLFNEIDI